MTAAAFDQDRARGVQDGVGALGQHAAAAYVGTLEAWGNRRDRGQIVVTRALALGCHTARLAACAEIMPRIVTGQ